MLTGQQVGLFGGPLYTPFKAATALARARQAAASGSPHVAVFWLAGEDHDFAEVNHVTFPARRELRTLTYSHSPDSAMPVGAYADFRTIAASRLVPLPPGISETLAAAVLTKGLTAHYLLFSTYAVKAGDTILVHAAAGGVGSILCQWAKHLGATVIGTVGSEHKASLARQAGCDFPILYAEEDFADAVQRITDGKGVPVVYDGVGKTSFEGSLRCLSPRGLLVSYGTASGPVPPFDVFRLNQMGSLYVTSPAFVTHTTERAELLERAHQLFTAIEDHMLRIKPPASYLLSEAATAHRELAARRTTGSTILVP